MEHIWRSKVLGEKLRMVTARGRDPWGLPNVRECVCVCVCVCVCEEREVDHAGYVAQRLLKLHGPVSSRDSPWKVVPLLG